MNILYKVPENWLRNYLEKRHPDLVEDYRRAADTTVAALKSGTLEDADVETLLGYVENGKDPLAQHVGDMLGKLANLFPSARTAIEKMAHSKKAKVRREALLSLLNVPPGALHEQVYAAALRDKGKSIRLLAARNIQSQRMAVLLPALRQAAAQETDPRVVEEMGRWLALISDGYFVTHHDDGTLSVTTRFRGGIETRIFDRADFDAETDPWLAERTAKWKADLHHGSQGSA